MSRIGKFHCNKLCGYNKACFFVESAARLERTFREPQSDKLGALRQAQDKKQAD